MSGPPSKETSNLLWLDEPGDYLRAAQEAGLESSVELITTPLKSDPPDALLARSGATTSLASLRRARSPRSSTARAATEMIVRGRETAPEAAGAFLATLATPGAREILSRGGVEPGE
jgi:hypothetical protein